MLLLVNTEGKRNTPAKYIYWPQGNCGYKSVQVGNKILTRAVLLLAFAISQGLRILLEQPQNSAAELHPKMEWLFGKYFVGLPCFELSVSSDVFPSLLSALQLALPDLPCGTLAWVLLERDCQASVVVQQ